MEKLKLTPWYELPENMRRALVGELQDEWPEMDKEDREYVMFQDPDVVKAAGLWPEERES